MAKVGTSAAANSCPAIRGRTSLFRVRSLGSLRGSPVGELRLLHLYAA
jgi:hypothetical protein